MLGHPKINASSIRPPSLKYDPQHESSRTLPPTQLSSSSMSNTPPPDAVSDSALPKTGKLCVTCGEPASKFHTRMFHQAKKTFTHPHTGERVTLDRQDDMCFHCETCEFANQDPDKLPIHYENCNPPSKAPPSVSTLAHATSPDVSTPGPVLPDEGNSQTATTSPDVNTPGPVRPAERDSPEPPEYVDINELYPVPDAHTVTLSNGIDLLMLHITINRNLRAAVCNHCHSLICPPNKIGEHILSHLRGIELPDSFERQLIDEFLLGHEPYFPPYIIPPVYGLPIEESFKYFCSECFRGYSSMASLKSHRNNQRHTGRTFMSHAQSITVPVKRYIPVTLRDVPRADSFSVDFAADFVKSITPRRDYSQLPIVLPGDSMSLSSFYYNDGWHHYTAGIAPLQLEEARRSHRSNPAPTTVCPVELNGAELRGLSEEFLLTVQAHIRANISFGLMDLMGQTSDKPGLSHAYRAVQHDSVLKYSLVLHRLVFNCLRYYAGGVWNSEFEYPPLSPVQVNVMKDLVNLLGKKHTRDQMMPTFKRCVHLLFCHTKTEYAETSQSSRFFSPVCSFVVIHSVTASGASSPSANLTPLIAALMYALRAAVLHWAVDQKQANPTKSVMELVKSQLHYLRDHFETPAGFMINANKVLTTDRNTSSHPSKIRVSSERELTLGGHTIPFHLIKKAVEMHETTYEHYVQKALLFDLPAPPEFTITTPISSLVEDADSHEIGYCFLDDARNDLAQYKSVYGEWLLRQPKLRDRFVYHDGQKMVWKPHACITWLRAFEQAQLHLVVGLILSAGPCARATEVCRYVLRDMISCPRNVGIVCHNVSLNSTQDKTSHRNRKDHFIPHIPTREWQNQLVTFLAVFHSFGEELAKQLLQASFPGSEALLTCFHHYLWPSLDGDHMDSAKLTAHMELITKKYLEVAIGPTTWRSVTTVIFQKYGKPSVQLNEYSDLANMHTTSTANKYYSGKTGTARGGDDWEVLGFLQVAKDWHKAINIGKVPVTEGVLNDESSHSSAAGEINTNAIVSDMRQEMNHQFYTMKQELIKSMQLTVTETTAQAADVYFPPPPLPSAQGDLTAVSNIVVHPSRLRALRSFLVNPSASFSTPMHGVLLERILLGEQHLLAVFPTGSGKTTLIFLVAQQFSKGKVSIVVLPLLSLHEDMHRRARQQGLKVSKFDAYGSFDGYANIVTVQVEALDTPAFNRYMHTLIAEGALYRIFCDEIHKPLTDIHYRQAFGKLSSLNLYGTQMIAFTGTLPPTLVAPLTEITNVQWHLLRQPSNRKELKFSMRRFPREQLQDAAAAQVMEALTKHEGHERILVYCKSKAICEEVAEAIGCDFYYAGSEEKIVVDFIGGKHRVLVCTTALNSGFDYPFVSLVIQLDMPYSLLDLLQGFGRGGRKGSRCVAMAILPEDPPPPKNDSHYDLGNAALMEWATSTDQCLRQVTSRFMDGVAVTCTLIEHAELCDFCEAQLSQPPPSRPQALKHARFTTPTMRQEAPPPTRSVAPSSSTASGAARLPSTATTSGFKVTSRLPASTATGEMSLKAMGKQRAVPSSQASTNSAAPRRTASTTSTTITRMQSTSSAATAKSRVMTSPSPPPVSTPRPFISPFATSSQPRRSRSSNSASSKSTPRHSSAAKEAAMPTPVSVPAKRNVVSPPNTSRPQKIPRTTDATVQADEPGLDVFESSANTASAPKRPAVSQAVRAQVPKQAPPPRGNFSAVAAGPSAPPVHTGAVPGNMPPPKPQKRPLASFSTARTEANTRRVQAEADAEWKATVDDPLLRLLNSAQSFCPKCFDDKLPDCTHALDFCPSIKAKFFGNKPEMSALRKTFGSMPSGYCFGCFRTLEAWGTHDPDVIASDCPHRGTLLRLALFYYLGEFNDHYGWVPATQMGSIENYARWLKANDMTKPKYKGRYMHLNLWVLCQNLWDSRYHSWEEVQIRRINEGVSEDEYEYEYE